MTKIDHLLANNRQWAAEVVQRDPDFFERLSHRQAPKYLWIGCSDSRVPANQIIGLVPGDVFVHRNVANLVVHTDLNCLSVIQYAVEVLGVQHIIVCGHYGCGGVAAALHRHRHGLIDNWLRHIQDTHEKYKAKLVALSTEHEQYDSLCELNVIEQCVNVGQTTIVEDAWARGQDLTVHGWIYDLRDGLLRDLDIDIGSTAELFERLHAKH